MNKQDNPHAKGLSVNEDVITEDYSESDWQKAIDEGRVAIVYREPAPVKVVINAMQMWIADEVSKKLSFLGLPSIGPKYSIRDRLFYLVVTKAGFYFAPAHAVKEDLIYCHHNGMDSINKMLKRPTTYYSDRSGLALTNPEE